jgi:hypothetical protein
MGDSYRIRTQVGINKTINLQLEQEYEFLEILSLKIQQSEIYNRNCADYGVVVGRVVANGGLGIPNAKVSIFIPVDSVDESNPIIQSIYPYKSPTDKNEDGYRYNLLPYEKSYSTHAATGTFPSRLDSLTGDTAVEIFDKYYKLTAKTNFSGDYMIMGVPLGYQTVVMDVDLSDIGEYSLTPQDLIRMGLATEAQVSGSVFKTSTDLNSLPQIINLTKSIDISPFWGDPAICQIAVNRLDFDLRNEANIEIRPTSIFMGSIYSSPDKVSIKPGASIFGIQIAPARPNPNLGNLCQLTTGPGQILAIRQTIQQDNQGNPILEEYRLQNSGNVIDTDGTWVVELPMNLDYYVTNEFGEKIISFDPTIGIPTKAKYRFKIKWSQPPSVTQQNRRAYFLVPNIKEYGWLNPNTDPNTFNNTDPILGSSYYFGLDWSGYTNGFFGQRKVDRTNEIINCEDTFYEFTYNKVYTTSSFIDEYGARAGTSFIGIKQIQNDDCKGNVNTFPTNDGVSNPSTIANLFSTFLQLFSLSFIVLLMIMHIVFSALYIITFVLCGICNTEIPIIKVKPFKFLCFGLNCNSLRFVLKLPMISYPSCRSCDCGSTSLISESAGSGTNGVLSFLSEYNIYLNPISEYLVATNSVALEDVDSASFILSQALAGNNNTNPDEGLFKTPKSDAIKFLETDDNHMAFSSSLPLGERINIFNGRKSYFDGINKIGVTFADKYNSGKIHYDNTITVLSNVKYQTGDLLTAVNPTTSDDLNYKKIFTTNSGTTYGITGTTITSPTTINVSYATSQLQNSNPVQYYLPTGSTVDRQIYPMDREYYQVVTAITLSEAALIWNTGNTQTFPNILNEESTIKLVRNDVLTIGYTPSKTFLFNPLQYFEGYQNQYILILQRGVDPYSPKYENKYQIGTIFGRNMGDITITANTRVNIPIQKLSGVSPKLSVQKFNQSEMFYPSYFFTPGSEYSGFSTTTLGYYGALEAGYSANDASDYLTSYGFNGVVGVVSDTWNVFYDSNSSAIKYDLAEDLSGGSFMFSSRGQTAFAFPSFGFYYSNLNYLYFTPNAYLYYKDNPISLSDKTKNVVRTDRLPSSDQLNGQNWETNPALLQQNNNFALYLLGEIGDDGSLPSFSFNTGIDPVDIVGLPDAITVVDSFECGGMVDLNCYSGQGSTFGIKEQCQNKEDTGIFSDIGDAVVNGCYIFVRRPILDLFKDIDQFAEWLTRYDFMYGVCRDVISEVFTNNWINGSLFTFPIRVNTYYNFNNQPIYKYPKELIYYDTKTFNFYYRSSPFNDTTNQFIGQGDVDSKNLLFPTTIVDLGMKSSFYQEIIFDPYTKSFIIPFIDSTSYGDNSDIINFYVISKLLTTSFWTELSIGALGLNSPPWTKLFNRFGIPGYGRIDGSAAQLFSINSEVGVIKFSSQFYSAEENPSPTQIYYFPSSGSGDKGSAIGIFFSSSTVDLQVRDYLTPGSINFASNNNTTSFQFNYGIKSQKVPFFKWRLGNGSTIFGTNTNNWITNSQSIVADYYQSLDRTVPKIPGYFQSTTIPQNNSSLRRGYIFSTDANGQYSGQAALTDNFIVGAPFQFYFGIKQGATAMDKFKQKYLSDE